MKALLNYFYFWTGLTILCLAKVKHKLQGYTSPKPFTLNEAERCIAYDLRTVAAWLDELGAYTGVADYMSGRRVLELGPGSDLGVGLALLAEGAAQYVAVDAHDLAAGVPPAFYEQLFEHLGDKADAGALRHQLATLDGGHFGQLDYVVRRDFDLVAALNGRKAEVIFSQAAFEHFDNIDKTIQQLTRVASDDAVLVMSVDLRTHSRWIRDKDPNNIYRYPAWLYRLMDFEGIPNRVRPNQYRAAFERNGWSDIVIKPQTALSEGHIDRIQPHLDAPYRSVESDMQYLTISLCARRHARPSQP